MALRPNSHMTPGTFVPVVRSVLELTETDTKGICSRTVRQTPDSFDMAKS